MLALVNVTCSIALYSNLGHPPSGVTGASSGAQSVSSVTIFGNHALRSVAGLRGALLYVYLPYNAMLSNVRELVTASSHVVIFAMPLLAMYLSLIHI